MSDLPVILEYLCRDIFANTIIYHCVVAAHPTAKIKLDAEVYLNKLITLNIKRVEFFYTLTLQINHKNTGFYGHYCRNVMRQNNVK